MHVLLLCAHKHENVFIHVLLFILAGGGADMLSALMDPHPEAGMDLHGSSMDNLSTADFPMSTRNTAGGAGAVAMGW